MSSPAIGPTLISTLCSRAYESSLDAWCSTLRQQVIEEQTISNGTAAAWGSPALAGQRMAWLANTLNEPWLRIIDSPQSLPRPAFTSYGWLSLEINVEDVDSLRPEIDESAFRVIGEPANLDVSDDIRAMQVIGPDDEVLYLTQIKAAVPPFELPFARCAVDRLFIPVAMVPDRETGMALYESFDDTQGLAFDTKITVINRALGLPVDTRHPVATIQLAGNNLVELDQIESLQHQPQNQPAPAAGIAMISFAVMELPAELDHYVIDQGPYQGQTAALMRGAGGELMELIQRT